MFERNLSDQKRDVENGFQGAGCFRGHGVVIKHKGMVLQRISGRIEMMGMHP